MTRKIFLLLAVLALFVTCEDPPDNNSGGDITYTVTFNKNGGNTEASPQTKTVTSPATTIDELPTPPTRNGGYTFTGWNTQTDGNGAAFTETTPVTADITVYAQWLNVPPGSFIVTFDKNGGDTEASPRTKTVTPPAATIDALPSQPTWANHDFTGWNTQADGLGTVFSAATTVTADITVYAQWEYVLPGSFIVTFDKNGGDTEASPRTKMVTSPATTIEALPSQPIWANHDFTGWNTAANGTGSAFTAATTVTDSITVYAQWELSQVVPPPPQINPPISPITYRNLFKELGGKTDAQIDAKVQGAWNRLFVNGAADQIIYYEVAPDMAYILDSGNNDVRSEGMSYGMMMCVQMNDKTRFDRLWKWARTYMYNDRTVKTDNIRGYFSWQCNTNGSVKDRNPAPDGEFYFVTALLFASARWGDGSGIFEYGREARNILFDMIHRDSGGMDNYNAPSMFDTTHKMPVFSTIGSAANHTDPSYHLPAFYDVWAVEIEEGEDYWDIWGGEAAAKTDAQFYRDAANASRAFFKTTVNATTGLGPDYAEFSGAPTGGQHADFRYDAWRIAMNIGVDYAWWQKDLWQVEFADRIQSFFHGKGVTSYGGLWKLDGTLVNEQSAGDHSPGLVACNAVASLAASHARRVDFINNFWDVPMTSGQYRYYDGCLYMLGMLHVSGNFKIYYPANRARSSNISPTSASFDKKAGAQADITVTMTLNGNTLSNIRNGSATLTQGTNYTVSGSTVTVKKEYLAQQPNGTTTLTFTFSAGSARTLAITIGDTTGGGPIGGGSTEYDFTANPSVTVGSTGTGTITGTVANGVLRVAKTNANHSTTLIVLTFNLGNKSLTDYKGLYVDMIGVSGDMGSKDLISQVLNGSSYVALTTSQSRNISSRVQIELPFVNSVPNLTGEISIAFGLNNTAAVTYDITSIRLVEK